MQIDIPSELKTITRDSISDEQAINDMGFDIPYMREYFASENIYLNAISDDTSYEIVIAMSSDEGTKQAWNLHDHNDSEINKAVVAIGKALEKQGLTFSINSIYKTAHVIFIVIDSELMQDDTMCYQRQYFTVVNGQGINIKAIVYGRPINEELADMYKTIIDSITFNEIQENPDPSGIRRAITNNLRGVLISGVGGASIGMITFIILRKTQPKNRMSL